MKPSNDYIDIIYSLLLDKALDRNKTKIKINNVCHNIKAEQQKEHCLQDDTIVKYKYIYTFNNIPNTITLY